MKIVGIDIGGTNIKSALVVNGRVKGLKVIPTYSNRGPEGSIAQIIKAIEPLVKEGKGIGIGIAGLIDSRQGIVKTSPNLKGWNGIPLVKILTRKFRMPVKIINDVDAICLGEWYYGVAHGYKNIFLLTIGTGVGGAAVCEGRLVLGANGYAGEFGHTIINFNGPKCSCGNYGCLERYVGARYIVRYAKQLIKSRSSRLSRYKELTPAIIAQEAKRGDMVAKQVFARVGFYLGIGITNIIALFDPDLIVISGGISRAGWVIFAPIRKTVQQRLLGENSRHYKIVASSLGDEAGILGASLLFNKKVCPV